MINWRNIWKYRERYWKKKKINIHRGIIWLVVLYSEVSFLKCIKSQSGFHGWDILCNLHSYLHLSLILVTLQEAAVISKLLLYLSVSVCVSGLSWGADLLLEQELKTAGEPQRHGKFRMLNKEPPHCALSFSASISVPLPFFSPFFLFHELHFSITPGPLLSPSESVASPRGASKVLIGTMLANGGRLEGACWCGPMLSPHPLSAWSGRNKRDEAMAGGLAGRVKNKMKCHYVRGALSARLYWWFSHK